MPLIEINWRPEAKVLRQFGAITAIALPLGSWWSTVNWRIVACASVIGATAGLLAWLRPTLLQPIFLAASLVTAPVGMIASELLVAIMYFGVFLPLGLLFRLLGRNPLDWRFRPTATTYWQPKQHGRSAKRYLRQF